jgi:putative tricarboxylic transport membrane protein
MRIRRFQQGLPYVVALAVFAGLWYLTMQLPHDASSGRFGPGAWPKGILLLAIATSIYALVTRVGAGDKPKVDDVIVSIAKSADSVRDQTAEDDDEPKYPRLLWTGIALTVGYVVLLPVLGFFLDTLLYMGSFMYAGGYRRRLAVPAISVLGTLVLMFVFMKVVYVSLPVGQSPFSHVTFALMELMAIR